MTYFEIVHPEDRHDSGDNSRKVPSGSLRLPWRGSSLMADVITLFNVFQILSGPFHYNGISKVKSHSFTEEKKWFLLFSKRIIYGTGPKGPNLSSSPVDRHKRSETIIVRYGLKCSFGITVIRMLLTHHSGFTSSWLNSHPSALGRPKGSESRRNKCLLDLAATGDQCRTRLRRQFFGAVRPRAFREALALSWRDRPESEAGRMRERIRGDAPTECCHNSVGRRDQKRCAPRQNVGRFPELVWTDSPKRAIATWKRFSSFQKKDKRNHCRNRLSQRAHQCRIQIFPSIHSYENRAR